MSTVAQVRVAADVAGARLVSRLALLVLTLTPVDQPGDLIRRERQALGLSTRDLASLAGVAYPTVSRIELGHEQPRWETLTRLAAALGKSWAPLLEPTPVPRLADLARRWTTDANGEPQVDWTAFRGLLDRLRLHPEFVGVAISGKPSRSGSGLVDNIIAAIAEKLADDAGIQRPSWTRRVAPLREPWSAPATPRRQAAYREQTPSQFLERNITLPTSALWRIHSDERP